eukprot:6456341-Amphidinium_carterae.1
MPRKPSDCEVVLAAVRENALALKYAREALYFAADDLLEDATFRTEARRLFYLLKLTMLSGRSTVVA